MLILVYLNGELVCIIGPYSTDSVDGAALTFREQYPELEFGIFDEIAPPSRARSCLDAAVAN